MEFSHGIHEKTKFGFCERMMKRRARTRKRAVLFWTQIPRKAWEDE